MQTLLFITGMFRSGTTLLSRIIQAHPDCCCANDPLLPFFKEIRNVVAKDNDVQLLRQDEPISDYYYDMRYNGLLQALLGFDMGRQAKLDQTALKEAIAKYTNGFSTLILPLLDQIGGQTYRDILLSAYRIIHKSYGTGSTLITGMKNPWLDEFSPSILSALDNLKVIHLIRDCRAVCSSKLHQHEKYPWPFMVRQWRKSGTVIWRNHALESSERILIVRYEDLVANPEKTCNSICQFLGIAYNPDMINPEKFIGHDGLPWRANTSYSQMTSGITTTSLDKWKMKLAAPELGFIETCCADVMRRFDYPLSSIEALHPGDVFSKELEMPEESLAQWLRPFLEQCGATPKNLGLEAARAVLCAEKPHLTQEQAEFYFLFREYYDSIESLG